MNIYKEKIKKIFNEKPDPENGRPGIRWAFEPIEKETKFLVIGINPSNSYKRVKEVINSFNKEFETRYKTKTDYSYLHKKLKNLEFKNDPIENQKKYDRFLSKEENKKEITLLKKLAHEHHRHYKKYLKFLNPSIKTLTENNLGFQFFDLFPVWGTVEKEFKKELKDDQKTNSINAFIDLVDRHPNIDSFVFLNRSAADFFIKEIMGFGYRQKKWDSIDRVNVGKSKIVKKSKFKLSKSNREIDIYCFAIGESQISDLTLKKFGEIFNSKLANM
jgi:hypothetical protein